MKTALAIKNEQLLWNVITGDEGPVTPARALLEQHSTGTTSALNSHDLLMEATKAIIRSQTAGGSTFATVLDSDTVATATITRSHRPITGHPVHTQHMGIVTRALTYRGEDGVTFEVHHPLGDTTGVTITFFAPNQDADFLLLQASDVLLNDFIIQPSGRSLFTEVTPK